LLRIFRGREASQELTFLFEQSSESIAYAPFQLCNQLAKLARHQKKHRFAPPLIADRTLLGEDNRGVFANSYDDIPPVGLWDHAPTRATNGTTLFDAATSD
jgi:hypothetical protein